MSDTDKWKPISTVPRNHEAVRLRCDDGKERKGWFYEGSRCETANGFFVQMEPDPSGIAVSATHWRDLEHKAGKP